MRSLRFVGPEEILGVLRRFGEVGTLRIPGSAEGTGGRGVRKFEGAGGG